MIAKELINIGYGITDIQEMISLFQKNLINYQKIFSNEEQGKVLLALHKLKGGLRILHFSHLLNDIESLEISIKAKGIKANAFKLEELIINCSSTSKTVFDRLQFIDPKI